jgi:hypothetical protein
MDFGSQTLQVLVGLIVILACAGVALVCDILKGNNEHLRELAVELKVRNEEAERRIKAAEKKGKRIHDLSASKPILQPQQTAAPVMGAAPGSSAWLQTPAPKVESKVAVEPVAAQPVPQQRRARPAGGRRDLSPAVAAVAEAANRIANRETPRAETAQAAAERQDAPPPAGRKNWDQLLNKSAAPVRSGHVIPFESIRESLPTGFQESTVLQRAMDAGKSITGLIVSIGTNELPADASADVTAFIRTLLAPQDFGCQSGSHEFVLVCNGEQGASARDRLGDIAESLWDYQLRSIGGAPLQFSWGSMEAKGDSLREVLGSAVQQMQETRSHRRASSIAQAV